MSIKDYFFKINAEPKPKPDDEENDQIAAVGNTCKYLSISMIFNAIYH